MIEHRSIVAFACVVVFVIAGITRGQANEPLPSMQELQQLQTDKNWTGLLQKLQRVLALRADAAKNYDRYALLTMKGEAHAQLKQPGPASSAFNDAAKEAGADKNRAAVASATGMLIKRSQQFVYKRKSPTTQPSDPKEIDVLDAAKRKDGFAALAADELAALQPKVKSATSANNLRPVVELMKSMDDLQNAELAAYGNTSMSDSLLPPLAAHSKELSAKYVADQKRIVDKIEQTANQVIDVGPDRRGAYQGRSLERKYKKRGLTSPDQNSLKSAMQTCNEIATGDKEMAEAFGSDLGKPLLDAATEAKAVADKAESVLKTDYTITTSDPKGLK
jgi:hypothetical protein